MGRKSRLKSLRQALKIKLEAAGLKSGQFMIVNKTAMVREPVLKDGKPVLDENGQPRYNTRKIERHVARNPLKGLMRKMMKEDEDIIKVFLRTPVSASKEDQ